MIEARTARGADFCTSGVRKHELQGPERAIVVVTIGDATAALCEECARDAFNALGFMITSTTGISLAKLVGLKTGRAKR